MTERVGLSGPADRASLGGGSGLRRPPNRPALRRSRTAESAAAPTVSQQSWSRLAASTDEREQKQAIESP